MHFMGVYEKHCKQRHSLDTLFLPTHRNCHTVRGPTSAMVLALLSCIESSIKLKYKLYFPWAHGSYFLDCTGLISWCTTVGGEAW